MRGGTTPGALVDGRRTVACLAFGRFAFPAIGLVAFVLLLERAGAAFGFVAGGVDDLLLLMCDSKQG